MAMNQQMPQLLIFTRYPMPGQVKTRLIPELGPEGAARLQRRMTEHVLDMARAAGRFWPGSRLCVCYTGAARRCFRDWLGGGLQYAQQGQGDLGLRMQQAFGSAFRKGAAPVVLMGTDVPGITSDILGRALQALQTRDVVLGPAADGGYYLIGMRVFSPGLFEGIDWSTGQVAAQTRKNMQRLGLQGEHLPVLRDMDSPEDLDEIRQDHRFADLFAGRTLVSVIIPTLNEAHHIADLLARLLPAEHTEVIVVDGGSSDDTRAIASRCGARVLQNSGGRALQQNAGAAAARGRILLFLHADTLPPEGYADLIRRAMDRPERAGGAFRFKTDLDSRVMRCMEWGTNIRSAVLQLPYGDQGLFLEKRVFESMGGFPEIPIMEDFVLIRRLRGRGRIVTLPEAVQTSARRWQNLGVLRTFAINQLMILGYSLGVPVERLDRLYRGVTARK